MSKRYIHVPRWFGDKEHPGFQHYAERAPIWIKNYTRLLDDDAYLDLTPPQRALLHGLWLAYAKTHGKVPESTAWLSRYLALRVTKRMLDALNHAGFITFSASSGLAGRKQDASPELETEKENNQRPTPRSSTTGPALRLVEKREPDDMETLGESGTVDAFFADLERKRGAA